MPFTIIPVDANRGAQRKSVVLEGRRFTLHFFFCVRTDSWYLHIDNSAGTRLVSGWRLTTLYPITDRSDRRRWPRGYLTVLSGGETAFDDPDREAMGTTHFLMYLPYSQLSELVAVAIGSADA